MIDEDLLRIQRSASWTDAEMLSHMSDHISDCGGMKMLYSYLSSLRKIKRCEDAKSDPEYQECERFLMEEFTEADNPAEAITEFLGARGHARGMNYIIMIAENNRKDPRLAPILDQLKASLLG